MVVSWFCPGVVAPDFRVHRTANLRIVDASVIPFTFSVAPLATVFAIAEKVIYMDTYCHLFFLLTDSVRAGCGRHQGGWFTGVLRMRRHDSIFAIGTIFEGKYCLLNYIVVTALALELIATTLTSDSCISLWVNGCHSYRA
jgi:hypothetical protein